MKKSATNPIYKETFAVEYKIHQHGDWLNGIAIGSGTGDVDVIVNSKGKVETKIWDFRYNVAYSRTVFNITQGG